MKILFFAPHSAIWVHAFPEALVAEALSQSGHDVVYVGCGRQFRRFCVPMRASRLGPESDGQAKRSVCEQCDRNKDLIRDRFGFRGYDISEVLNAEDLTEADRVVAAAQPSTFLDIMFDGVAVGRSALSTYLLTFKKGNLDFSPDEWSTFSIELRNTLYSFLACRRILERERPDRVVLYSSGYSVNLVWCLLAEQRGIPFYYMNAGANLSDRLQKLVISRGHSLQRRLLDYWHRFKERPCSLDTLGYITDHLVEVIHGRSPFVYSAGKSGDVDRIRSYFGLSPGQKLLLATMSSYDEVFAAQITGLFPTDIEMLFPSQIEWIKAVIEWIKSRPDLFLIVRVHPREFPNKRDRVKSDHALELESALVRLPPNVRVNWPSDGISLYDLAKVTDVCLNAWSSVGKEMSLLGVPVVIYAPEMVFYPADLNLVGTTRESYFRRIDEAVRRGWSVETMRLAFRWQALEDRYSRIDVSDGYSYHEHARNPIWQRLLNRLRRMVDADYRQKQDCRDRPASLRAKAQINALIASGSNSILDLPPFEDSWTVTLEEETRGLRSQAARLHSALYDRASRDQDDLGRRLLHFAHAPQ